MVALVLVDHLMMQFAQCNILGRDIEAALIPLLSAAACGGEP